MAKRSVLVADNDTSVVEIIKSYLIKDGYEVFTAYNGKQFYQLFEKVMPSLIILSISLPDISGVKICSNLRKKSDVPIIMLSEGANEGEKIKVTPNEYKLLTTMIKYPNVFTREKLATTAFENGFKSYTRVIDTHIKNLRKKVESDPQKPEYIITVHGIGYRFGRG